MALRSELRIDSRIEEVARARRWLVEHAAAEGFSEHEVRQLGLVVSEACANVVEHAYDGRAGNPIDLALAIDDRVLTLSIRDVGAPFDVDTYAPPDFGVPQEGGYGVHIIRSVMDSVRYDTSETTGTTLTLTKRRGP
jgi:serine/threonine-protein kinase RsbW